MLSLDKLLDLEKRVEEIKTELDVLSPLNVDEEKLKEIKSLMLDNLIGVVCD